VTGAPVHILSTGVANIASVAAAIERCGRAAVVTARREDVVGAAHLVVPGVGAFGAAMARLEQLHLVEPLTERVRSERPTLSICLGMQLLFDSSEESPGVRGLGIIPGCVTRFPRLPGLRVPQLGFNMVALRDGATAFDSGYAYYANSYRVAGETVAPGWTVATTDYAGLFLGAVCSSTGRVVGCQFHPELSGKWGHALISRWLNGTAGLGRDRGPSLLSAGSLLATRVVPCLDVRDGRVVKGMNFVNLRDAGDPASLARAYEEQGADELVMLDVSATVQSRAAAAATVRAIRRAISIPLTVGGGVRSVEDAGARLDAGADKVSVNSAAVANPGLIDELSRRFGAQCAVVAIDAASTSGTAGSRFAVFTHSGARATERDAIAWGVEAQSRGAGEILLTSINRDGTQEGYDLPLLRAVSDAVSIPIIASGGAGEPSDLVDAIKLGRAHAVLAAGIFHDGRYSIVQVKAALAEAGLVVRQQGAQPC